MDLQYFKEQIEDELKGAKCYAKNAIEVKAMNPDWGKKFLEMSDAELTHAASLYKMFREYYARISEAYEEVPSYMAKINKEVVDVYTEMTAKIKYMHEMYTK